MIQDTLTKNPTQSESLQEMSQSKLDYWLMRNIKIMEELTIEEPSSWLESDFPG